MYTTHHACWDAKNRFNLPEELELSYKPIAHLFSGRVDVQKKSEDDSSKDKSTNHTKLQKLMEESNVRTDDLEQVVIERGHYPENTKIDDFSEDFINRWIFPNWKKIVDTINKNKEGDK